MVIKPHVYRYILRCQNMSLRAQGVSKHVIMRERVKDKNQNKLLINTKIDKLHLNEPGYSLSLVIIV